MKNFGINLPQAIRKCDITIITVLADLIFWKFETHSTSATFYIVIFPVLCKLPTQVNPLIRHANVLSSSFKQQWVKRLQAVLIMYQQIYL